MNKQFCVYITMYTGELLPKWYIGSTNSKNIEMGYTGSVKSIEWKNIYESEKKENKHLFKTKILSYHNTRKEALVEELRLHKLHNVVKNEKYMNKSLAAKNGCFGMGMDDNTKIKMVEKRLISGNGCYHNNNNPYANKDIIDKIKYKRKQKSILNENINPFYRQYILCYKNKEYNFSEFCKEFCDKFSISEKNFKTFLKNNNLLYVEEDIIENFLYLRSIEPKDKKFLYRNIIEKEGIKYSLYYKLTIPKEYILIEKYIHKERIKQCLEL